MHEPPTARPGRGVDLDPGAEQRDRRTPSSSTSADSRPSRCHGSTGAADGRASRRLRVVTLRARGRRCQPRNVRPSASSSARLATGLPTPWPARPSWNSRIGRSSWHDDAACSSAAILRACSGSTRRVALGRREQRRRVARAVDDVVVRRVGVQPGELLGDVGVAVLARPQPGDEELREADHVEQRHAAPARPGRGRGAASGRRRRAGRRSSRRGWRGARGW